MYGRLNFVSGSCRVIAHFTCLAPIFTHLCSIENERQLLSRPNTHTHTKSYISHEPLYFTNWQIVLFAIIIQLLFIFMHSTQIHTNIRARVQAFAHSLLCIIQQHPVAQHERLLPKDIMISPGTYTSRICGVETDGNNR